MRISDWSSDVCSSDLLQDEDGQIAETHSVSAGLDYAAVGPEHALMRDTERAFYISATAEEALNAFQVLCHSEGIIRSEERSVGKECVGTCRARWWVNH